MHKTCIVIFLKFNSDCITFGKKTKIKKQTKETPNGFLRHSSMITEVQKSQLKSLEGPNCKYQINMCYEIGWTSQN